MLGFFGPGVEVTHLSLAFEGGAVQRPELALVPALVSVDLLEAKVLPNLPPIPAPELHGGLPATPVPAVLPGPALALAAVTQPRSLTLPTPKLKALAAQFTPVARQDLTFMRARPIVKRGVPAGELSDEQATYWTKRLADSRRIGPRMIKLVAVFPDLELEDGKPVAYRAEEDAIAYHLPEHPLPPSTIVIARHAQTGEPMQGRFYRD
ncbi:MAG: hypothetical protein JWM80_3719 [Cyanobacteria bacterium RYN_339]|nr:hypothetical protein [Cyanobacteria bacterium RYN_339]